MVSCGIDTIDHLRAAYAASRISAIGAGGAAPLRNALLDSEGSPANADQAAPSNTGAALIGKDSKEMKNRREITAEFLFFELAAVGFLGLAAMLFKEKDMGVIRIHAVIPVQRNAFILSKLGLILLSDLVFSAMLTLINLGGCRRAGSAPRSPHAGRDPLPADGSGRIFLRHRTAGFQAVFTPVSRTGGIYHHPRIPCRTDRTGDRLDKVSSHVPSVSCHEKRIFPKPKYQSRLLCGLRMRRLPAVPPGRMGAPVRDETGRIKKYYLKNDLT